MKKLALLLVSFSIVVAGCYGQSDKKGQPATSVQPKANIKVNKEYDKNGRLIRYDSTYTYVYPGTDSLFTDEFFKEFEQRFNSYFISPRTYMFPVYPFPQMSPFYEFFQNDSSMVKYNQYRKQIEKLYKEIDSIRNAFYFEQFNSKTKKK
ncbi:MAG TPA: hypothetical protein DEO33_05245 [Rikenellaceae bacterium]|mgnify:CR=1 FL=1|jgi:hypothetical protein|nr:hypothetical protein [Rikenellaceae bacterium]HRR50054.1 hypothetical protein [Bacteroidales bacterium]